jgi:hypothetical protein
LKSLKWLQEDTYQFESEGDIDDRVDLPIEVATPKVPLQQREQISLLVRKDFNQGRALYHLLVHVVQSA